MICDVSGSEQADSHRAPELTYVGSRFHVEVGRLQQQVGVAPFETGEVMSSSLLVPTISLNHLASLTSLRDASKGAITRAEPGRGPGEGAILPRT